MQVIYQFYLDNPFWAWIALGALFLAVEIGTGTQYLLWPAVAAGVIAVLALLGVRLGLPVELVVFALLTIGMTLVSRRLFGRTPAIEGRDVNDQASRFIGRRGETSSLILEGRGRVFVDGAEWNAELEGGGDLPIGVQIEVIGLSGGSSLKVRSLPSVSVQ